MFKKIPGTTDLRISLSGEIVNMFGEKIEYEKSSSGTVEIDFFGNKEVLGLNWLKLLSWYECGDILDLQNNYKKIKFFPADWRLKTKSGFVMQFIEPVDYADGLRVIPCFPRYAVNKDGTVLVDTTKNVVIQEERITQSGYVTKYIYSPDRNSGKDVGVHRLVCLAWLPNSDFLNKPIVNHINGVKTDNALANLEWCSHSENAQHAIDTGLNQCSIPMKTRDVVTGKIEIFQSAAELSRKLGLSRGYSPYSFLDRLPGFLFKKRYEIKRAADNTPWYYERSEFDEFRASKNYYDIEVLNKQTGAKLSFRNTRKFMTAFKIWNTGNVEEAIAILNKREPWLEVSYRRNFIRGPYRVLNIADNTEAIVKSLKAAAEAIGIGKNELNSDIRREKKFVYSEKWVVLADGVKFDKAVFRDKPKPFSSIEITDHKNGCVILARSIREASRLTRVTTRTVKKLIKNETRHREFSFRPLRE